MTAVVKFDRPKELNKLKALLWERSVTREELASFTGINVRELDQKLNGFISFDANEMDMIATRLDIETLDVGKHFFY